jgi:class 3 adenylate cyclase
MAQGRGREELRHQATLGKAQEAGAVLVNSAFGLSAVPEFRAYSDEPIDPNKELEERLARLGHVAETWGRDPQALVDLFCPSQSGNPAFVRWAGRFQRQTASPADFQRQLESILGLDANDRLADIKAPTLVLNVTGDRLIHPVSGRYLAAKIPGARFVEFPGEDHLCWIMPSWRQVMDCWIEFVTGKAPGVRGDRRFATVLFTDIVGSSERLAALGDRAWRGLLEQHHVLVRRELARFRGVEVDTAGDGFFASFDGPARAIRCASSIVEAMSELDLDVRAGLHTGECEVVDGKVAGIAVHTGARVASHAAPGEVLVSSTVKDLVAGSGIGFVDRGARELKGVPGEWRLYAVDRVTV